MYLVFFILLEFYGFFIFFLLLIIGFDDGICVVFIEVDFFN